MWFLPSILRSLRAFLNSPGNGLFAGGVSFALGLHLGVKNCDKKKLVDLTADFFTHKSEFPPSDLPLPSDLPPVFAVRILGLC